MPKAVWRHIAIPMPELPATGGTGEKRREKRVVQQRPLAVLRVQDRGARMVRLHRADFGEKDGLARIAVAEFPHRIGRENVHRPATDV